MVFGCDYDKSLWLILAGDRRNREKIAELVSNIPNEIFERIHQELEKYNNCDEKKFNSDEWIKFNKLVRIDNEKNNGYDNYLYSVEMNYEEIKIKLCIWENISLGLEENIELSLVSISSDDLMAIDLFDSTCVGSYSYMNSRVVSLCGHNSVIVVGDEREYQLVSTTTFGVLMRTSESEKISKMINLKKMPDDISLNDLSNRRNVNKLVRARKK